MVNTIDLVNFVVTLFSQIENLTNKRDHAIAVSSNYSYGYTRTVHGTPHKGHPRDEATPL